MSSNSNNSAEVTGFAFVIAIIGIAGMFLFALAAFAALVLSVIAFFAWNKPLRLGKHTLMPEEARAFVRNGLIGAALAPVFCLFLELMFGIRINSDYLPQIVLGGYTLGSLGVEFLFEEEQQAAQAHDIVPLERLPAASPPQRMERPAPVEPFRFASWDDEDASE